MKIARGQTRIALVGNKYTVKLPVIRAKYFLGTLKATLSLKYEPVVVLDDEEDLAFSRFAHLSNVFRQFVLNGFKCNWSEYVNSKKFSGVAVPTRFSFLGALNIQDTVLTTDFSQEERALLYEEIPDTRAKMGHVFTMEGNFGLHSGKIKFVDYGDWRTIDGLMKHKDDLRRVFDVIQQMKGQSVNQAWN